MRYTMKGYRYAIRTQRPWVADAVLRGVEIMVDYRPLAPFREILLFACFPICIRDNLLSSFGHGIQGEKGTKGRALTAK
jgi:hypothetical protein